MQLRAFQKRLLDEVTNYFEDGHMHIVAPPGAGKTVLGAKVVDQRNQKTLILVPSIMLKNQWQKVLTNFFDPQQLSVDLLAPELITLATYQDFFEKQERLSMDQSWELLVLDEAHHLKKTWAAMLLQMQKKAQINTLSLTATPPYDAAESDWQRYVTLNGPIDEEIATAELISDGILTPYQDYVYLIAVSKESEEAFNEYLKKNEKIAASLASDPEVTDYLLTCSFIQAPLEWTEFIYNNLGVYVSCLSYLIDQNYQLTKDHWRVLGLFKQRRQLQLPTQTSESLQKLYDFLYNEQPNLEIFSYLEKVHWLDQQGLRLFPAFHPRTQTANIPLKKEAIAHIILKEELFLGSKLCGVIFLDHIKERGLINPDDLTDFGVVPVFVSLAKLVQPTTEIAAICGSFLIISEKLLFSEKVFFGLKEVGTVIQTAPAYRKIPLTDKNRKEIIQLATLLLEQKKINLLVGTVSLLGEGWDCPTINTLILANASGTFVQTQQLRGRGLRKAADKGLTNIWHIAPVYPGVALETQPELSPILKRMSFIEGLNLLDNPQISTGIARFELPQMPTAQNISSKITDNFNQAREREYYQQKWKEALAKGSHLSLPLFMHRSSSETTEKKAIAIEDSQIKRFFFHQNFRFFSRLRNRLIWQRQCKQLETMMYSIYQLLEEEQIITGDEKLVVFWNQQNFSCRINTKSYQVQKKFNDVACELLKEIKSPRYLIQIGANYYAVPKKYGGKRQEAERFLLGIHKKLPKAKLFYTRTPEGRKKLIEAYFRQEKHGVIEEKIWE